MNRAVKEGVEHLHDPRTEESDSSGVANGLQVSSAEVLDENFVSGVLSGLKLVGEVIEAPGSLNFVNIQDAARSHSRIIGLAQQIYDFTKQKLPNSLRRLLAIHRGFILILPATQLWRLV